MDMSVSIAQFEEAREYMADLVVKTLQSMEIGIYDPWLKHIFEQEIKSSIKRQFSEKYPGVDVNFNFTIYLSSQTIEYSVQRYYHPFSEHKYLGSIMDSAKKDKLVDCYYSNLYETFGEPRIIVRDGHSRTEMKEAGASAADQYYKGLETNIAKGYQLALESGYVREMGVGY